MKYFYFFILPLGLLLLSSCSENTDAKVLYQQNFEIIGDEKASQLQHLSDHLYEPSYSANETTDEAHSSIGGVFDELSVSQGRYTITGQGSGNVLITDEENDVIVDEVVGSAYGVNSLTVDLASDHTVRVDGFDQVSILPAAAEPEVENVLTAGVWEVGVHIEPGNYQFSTSASQIGYVKILDKNDSDFLFEVLGGEYSSSSSEIELLEGQKIVVSGISLTEWQQLPEE
ncbi:hypothetical protein [Halalkalibacillus halophilus]|uniref:hypothetical protein n=1 Tax=Halalkalibacillus halophilus TaxID=392827 RepID=UPI000400F8E2|nr:hypothetical protein [Halalkalibacillus halophilus]